MTALAFEIRTLTEADASTYHMLRLEALRDSPRAFMSSFAEYAARPIEATTARLREQAITTGAFTLGAFHGEQLVGTVAFQREERDKVRHKGWILAMYVTPAARGQGIAQALVSEAIARARQLPGLEQINLGVSTTQEPARRLYASLGFVVWGIERRALKVDGEDVDEEMMVLPILPSVSPTATE